MDARCWRRRWLLLLLLLLTVLLLLLLREKALQGPLDMLPSAPPLGLLLSEY